ncbi:hypothetical protein ANN_03898 [Periplaneta americana]|uniref:Core Histone H2A/H2B/H3 domain-containing protein n=1 Tax=Periplaneta americana TaxID=6978 RepID=A0ABQ8T8Y0_PERAM|nr:hypothetical protein ANN_03898 [Periplaneta americana]
MARTGKAVRHCPCELNIFSLELIIRRATCPQSFRKAAKKARKAQKNISKGDKKTKRKRKKSYAIYIYKVLKQAHPDTGISSKAMSIMNSFVNDIFERIARKLRGSRITTSGRPSPVRRSRQPSVSCYPVSWPNTPSVKGPRPSQNTLVPSKRECLLGIGNRPFLGPQVIHNRVDE